MKIRKRKILLHFWILFKSCFKQEKDFEAVVLDVEKYFKDNFNLLEDKKIHFASRLYLWSKDEFARGKAFELKKEYIGETEVEIGSRLKQFFVEENGDLKNCLAKEEREKFFQKYPKLKNINKILFRNLLCKNIYDLNLEKHIGEIIADEELLKIKRELENDAESMLILSTHAINFLYLLDFYKEGEIEYRINPEKYLQIFQMNAADVTGSLQLGIYFLTHCIIGESHFYARKIKDKKNVYLEMLHLVEKMVANNFKEVSLDNKFEFLVCAKLCEYESHLQDSIFKEARVSISKKGRYFVDKHNGCSRKKESLRAAEHRNVLAIMSCTSSTLD